MKPRGQALVEMALALPVFLILILATMDVWPAIANSIIAKSLSARGARAAAVSLPPDDCPLKVASAIGTPELLFSDLTYTAPCVTGQTFAQGEAVSVTVVVEYHPVMELIWGDPVILTLETTDYGR